MSSKPLEVSYADRMYCHAPVDVATLEIVHALTPLISRTRSETIPRWNVPYDYTFFFAPVCHFQNERVLVNADVLLTTVHGGREVFSLYLRVCKRRPTRCAS
eukprot:SAG31_NODE_25429_length_461_cov_1.624309_1_plen_101_part_01